MAARVGTYTARTVPSGRRTGHDNPEELAAEEGLTLGHLDHQDPKVTTQTSKLVSPETLMSTRQPTDRLAHFV